MPTCAAINCNNRSGQQEVKVKMNSFPSDPSRRLEWVKSAGQTGLRTDPFSKQAFLCEEHFSSDMWETIRVDGSKKLKCTAIPTIFGKELYKQKVSNKEKLAPRVVLSQVSFNSKPDIQTSQVLKNSLRKSAISNNQIHLSVESIENPVQINNLNKKLNQQEFKIQGKIESKSVLGQISHVHKQALDSDQVPLRTVPSVNTKVYSGESQGNLIQCKNMVSLLSGKRILQIIPTKNETSEKEEKRKDLSKESFPDKNEDLNSSGMGLAKHQETIAESEEMVIKRGLDKSKDTSATSSAASFLDQKVNTFFSEIDEHNYSKAIESQEASLKNLQNEFDSTNSRDLLQKYSKLEKLYFRSERLRKAMKATCKKKYRKWKNIVEKLQQRVHYLEQNLPKNLNKVLGNDQLDVLSSSYRKPLKWSNLTLTKAYQLKFACGNNGYKELINQGIPLPSVRTLCRHLET